MEETIIVPFAQARVRRDEISRCTLARAYLHVLAAAAQLPLMETPPQEVVEEDWSDYEYPSRKEYLQWGDAEYGLRLLTSAQYVNSRPGGWLGFWVFQLPPTEGRKLAGNSKIHSLWHSFAQLTVEGSTAWTKRLKKVFLENLLSYDQREEAEGRARALLEGYLTQLCWHGKELLELDMKALRLATPRQTSAVVSSSRFLQALAQARRGEKPDLASIGEDWAYGMATRYESDGRPAGVVWNDEFPPQSARAQLQLLEAGWALQQGNLERARELRGLLADSRCSLARQGIALLAIT